MNDYKNQTITQRLNNLPIEIYQKELDLLKAKTKAEELQVKMKLIETSTADEIFRQLDATTQKKVFTNDTMRKSELIKRLKAHQGYANAEADFEKIRQNNAIGEIELSYMKRVFRSAEALTRNN